MDRRPMDQEQLTRDLPESIAARVKSARMVGDRAVVVLDATGLGTQQRSDIEQAVVEILGARDGVSEVRVALMADKVRRRIIAVGSGKGGVGRSEEHTSELQSL